MGNRVSPQKTVSVGGTTKISNVMSKFGATSAYFNGGGDFLSVPDVTLEGDFSITFWINSVYPKDYQRFFYNNSLRVLDPNSFMMRASIEALSVYTSSGAAEDVFNVFTSGVWHYIELSRSGSSNKMFLDGVLIGEYTDSTAYRGPFYIGATERTPANEFIYGYMNDFHIVSGVPGHTGNYTVPETASVPNQNTILLLSMNGEDGSSSFVDNMTGSVVVEPSNPTPGQTIKFKRGNRGNLPVSAHEGEPVFCKDTGELFIGTGTGIEMAKCSVDGGEWQ